MAAVTASPRLRRIQRGSVALLVLGCAVNYVDRSTLAIANPLIRHDLGLSIADMGLLLSAFLWAYAAFQLPAGALVDRLGSAQAAGARHFHLVDCPGGRRPGRRLLAVRCRARLPRHGRVAAILRPRARGARLVQRARAWPADRHRPVRFQAWPGDRAAIAHRADARVRLALDVHHHGRRRRCCRSPVVRGVSRAARGRTDRGRASLPCRWRGAAGCRSRHLGGLEAVVRLPRHVGHGAGLLRRGLHGLGVPGVAARLPGNRTPYEHCQDRLGRGDPVCLRRYRQCRRGVADRPSGGTRRVTDQQLQDPRGHRPGRNGGVYDRDGA